MLACFSAKRFDFGARGFGLEQGVINETGYVAAAGVGLAVRQADARRSRLQGTRDVMRAARGNYIVRTAYIAGLQARHDLISDLLDELIEGCVHVGLTITSGDVNLNN
jgi:hypothetical protein